MIPLIVAILVAAGLTLLLGWPFWTIIIFISLGAGLSLLRARGNTWVGPVAALAALMALLILGSQYASGQLPLTASLLPHIKLGHDLDLANALTDPAVKPRATALILQTAREDASAEKVARLYRAGKPKEAIAFIQKLVAEGREVRSAISLTSPPDHQKTSSPSPPTPEQALANSRLAAVPAPAPPLESAEPPKLDDQFTVPDWELVLKGEANGKPYRRSVRIEVEISADRERLTMTQRPFGKVYIFKGVRVSQYEYTGSWREDGNPNHWGEFGLTFTPDAKSACGWRTTRKGPGGNDNMEIRYDPK